MQFGLPTAHDGQIASEKNLLSCWGIIESLIPFNASVSAAEFQQAKPPSPALKLCVLLMLQNVNNDTCMHLSQLNVQWISSPSNSRELKNQLKNSG